MSRMYNTTVYSGMNDVSVTTGNADGWVMLVRDPVTATPPKPANGRSALEPTRKKSKRSGKSRVPDDVRLR